MLEVGGISGALTEQVLVLRVDWREKAGSIKLSGRVEGGAFEALVPAQTDQYSQVEALKLRAFHLKFIGA